MKTSQSEVTRGSEHHMTAGVKKILCLLSADQLYLGRNLAERKQKAG